MYILTMACPLVRLSKTRSASTSLLDKTNHHQLHGSGWSVGHDPKSGRQITMLLSYYGYTAVSQLYNYTVYVICYHVFITSCNSSIAFFTSETTDPESDSMIGKPRFPDTEEDISSDASTGFHSQSITNVESFATFV